LAEAENETPGPFLDEKSAEFRARYDLYAKTETPRVARWFSYQFRVCVSARFDV
jgi:hypothetical protein